MTPDSVTTKRALPFAICSLLAESSHAAAPLYFDLGGLITIVVLYFLGVLALLVKLVLTKKKGLWTWVFVIYIGGPLVLIGAAINHRGHGEPLLEGIGRESVSREGARNG